MVEASDNPIQPKAESPELGFHEHARDQLTQQIRTYGQELIRESVSAARAREHPLVQQKDVQFAAHRLHTAFRNRKTVFLQFMGAGLLGVFLQGFTTEMLAEDPNLWAVVVYVVAGFAGLFGVFWSLLR